MALFNQVETTKKCIELILKNAGDLSFELIFFDNGSEDDTLTYLKSIKYDHIKIAHSPVNLGFGYAHNQNLKIASGEYLLLLNNDLFIYEDNFLQKIKDKFNQNSNLALLGFEGGFTEINNQGQVLITDNLEYIDGSSLTIPTSLAEKYGLFSPEILLFYWEDVDLSFKYRQMGYDIDNVDINYEHTTSASGNFLHYRLLTLFKDYNYERIRYKWGQYLKNRKFFNQICLIVDNYTSSKKDLITDLLKRLKLKHPTAKIFLNIKDQKAESILSGFPDNLKLASNKDNFDLIINLSSPDFNLLKNEIENLYGPISNTITPEIFSKYQKFYNKFCNNFALLQPFCLSQLNKFVEKFDNSEKEILDLNKRLHAVKNGWSFRIGRIITFPFRFIHN